MTLSGVVVFYKATDKVGGSLRVPGMTYRPNFWRKREGVGRYKTPAVTGRKGNANKARAIPETGCPEEA